MQAGLKRTNEVRQRLQAVRKELEEVEVQREALASLIRSYEILLAHPLPRPEERPYWKDGC